MRKLEEKSDEKYFGVKPNSKSRTQVDFRRLLSDDKE